MIHVSSENISENLIKECEEFFGCRIVNYYGQSEQAVLGVNLNRTDSINLLPYTNVYQRDDGTLAATNLLNWSTPLVNYHVADKLIETSPNQYRIIGRTNVLFKHTDGYWVSTVNIYTLMQFYSRLEKWQIVQFISDGTVRLHYRGELNVDDKKLIQEGLEMRFGTWRVAFFDGDFIYSGQGKINPILCLKE
jgi:phenylacetate-coenzyme A ligase PaaK-like adenylate-forming protein